MDCRRLDNKNNHNKNNNRLDDGSSRMYYTGQSLNGNIAIGVAKDQDGSGIWIREQATITFALA
jgi:hypothetical protein